MRLETQHLLVREWRESDVDCYLTLSMDVGYNCFSRPGQFLVNGADEARSRIQTKIDLFTQRKLGKFPVFHKASGEFLGTCGIAPYQLAGQPEIELGYRLCLKHWGKGYATEAAAAVLGYGFHDLKLPKIIAFAVPQNPASLRIIEKLGFRYCRNFLHAEIEHRLYEMTRTSFPD